MNKSEEQAINDLKNKGQAWARIILRYIDKLEQKNKELEERNKDLTIAIEEWVNGERINDIKHISKDKIREKIKYLETKINVIPPDNIYTYREVIGMGIDVLEELLKEE